MKLLFTGTGRCGTGYIAELFRRLGVNADHELTFGIHNMPRIDYAIPGNISVSSSWLTVPFLEQIKRDNPELYIIHLVRNPEDVIKSFLGIGFFNGENQYRMYIRDHYDMPAMNAGVGWLSEYWVRANRMIKPYRDEVAPLDRITGADVLHWLDCIGSNQAEGVVAETIMETPKNINSRNRATLKHWLPRDDTLRQELVMEAKEYGWVV